MAHRHKVHRHRFLAEDHHRRPRSLKGSSDQANISLVRPDSHKIWHQLFGNLNAEQIANKINSSLVKPKGVTVICQFINGHPVEKTGWNYGLRDQVAFMLAWGKLFGEHKFVKNLQYINHVWLDPSYRLYPRS